MLKIIVLIYILIELACRVGILYNEEFREFIHTCSLQTSEKIRNADKSLFIFPIICLIIVLLC